MNELPILDERAIERLAEWGGEDLPRKLIEIFLSNTPIRMDQIRKGVEGNDPKEVEAGAHSLKSSAGNVGALRLQHLLQEMEDSAADQDFDTLSNSIPPLQAVFDQTLEALKSYMEGMTK